MSEVSRRDVTISRRTWNSEANGRFAFDWSVEIETCRCIMKKTSMPRIREKISTFTDIVERWRELDVSAIHSKIWNMVKKEVKLPVSTFEI